MTNKDIEFAIPPGTRKIRIEFSGTSITDIDEHTYMIVFYGAEGRESTVYFQSKIPPEKMGSNLFRKLS